MVEQRTENPCVPGSIPGGTTLKIRFAGAIAQLVEQRTENPCVPGSIPGGTTKNSRLRSSFCLVYNSFLLKTFQKSGLDKDMSDEQTDFIDELEPLNIEARYPSYKERLMKSLTADRCKDLIEQTDKLRTWIKSKL